MAPARKLPVLVAEAGPEAAERVRKLPKESSGVEDGGYHRATPKDGIQKRVIQEGRGALPTFRMEPRFVSTRFP